MNKLITVVVRFWLDGYLKWTDLDRADQDYILDIYRAKINCDETTNQPYIINELKKIFPFFFEGFNL